MTKQTLSLPVGIRPAAIEDGPRLAELSVQLGYPSSSEQVSARLIKVQSLDSGAVFIGEIDGRVAGWVEVHQRQPLLVDGGSEAEVMGLVVDAGLRRSGLGRKLMDKAERWAQSRGCRFLRVRTNVVRQDAHAFYERLGFAKVKTQTVYKKTLAENVLGSKG
ncbi:MAG: GNAT family N-acetyltransferase [Elusimicrobia bacterium]|nr:GNAT family N-acetyltransferase [Elusimicrobiota bacterium]